MGFFGNIDRLIGIPTPKTRKEREEERERIQRNEVTKKREKDLGARLERERREKKYKNTKIYFINSTKG